MSTPKVPEELKAGLPETTFGKILGATPVVMTVIATLLAGLSNSEMTKAQYARALAAQQQSKAGDQWALFQAKRLRGAIQSGTLDLVQINEPGHRIDADAMRAFAANLPDSAKVLPALELLLAGRLPEHTEGPVLAPEFKAVLKAVDDAAPESELAPLLLDIDDDALAGALRAARDHSRGFDKLLDPVVDGGDALGSAIDATGTSQLALRRDFAELRLRYSSMRYDAEAALNRDIANLHEIQVRRSNFVATRHNKRSKNFFVGMLAAQAAVVVSTLAIAARKRNLLWSLAAFAGLAAVAFATYVFLYV